MSGPVTYRRDESIATITMDDGKVNALGPTMLRALNEALDNADRDDVGAVVIAGNHRVFSGGFDLKVFTPASCSRRSTCSGADSNCRTGCCPTRSRWSWRAPARPSRWGRSCCAVAITESPRRDTTFRPMRLPSEWSYRMRPWRS